MDWFKSLKSWASTQTTSQMVEHSLVTFGVLYFAKKVYETGLLKVVTRGVLSLPGAKTLLNDTLEKESQKALNDFLEHHDCKDVSLLYQLPDEGWSEEKIIEILNKLKQGDVKPETGKVWAYVYALEEESHHKLIEKCHNMFLETNGLNPMAFNSLRRMENDVVRMSAQLLGGDKNVRGTLTTGGTESILLAVKSYRDMAKAKTSQPEMILPTTIHPAFLKAASYFQVKPIMIQVNDQLEADVVGTRKAINKNTVLIVASAPQYPHGIIDPVGDFAKLALEHGLPLHVDSCIGGFVLPFAKKLDGVTSISADIHKYGYSLKGASVLLFKTEELRKNQYFAYSEWPGGLFISPSMPGTRGGGPIAAAYASLVSMGTKGYLEQTQKLYTTAEYLKKEVSQINCLEVLGTPKSSLFAFKSKDPNVNIFSVGDEMEKNGWKIECQNKPDSIHCTLFPKHIQIKEKFIQDLKDAVKVIQAEPEKYKSQGKTGMYGMTAVVPDEVIFEDFLKAFMSKLYQ